MRGRSRPPEVDRPVASATWCPPAFRPGALPGWARARPRLESRRATARPTAALAARPRGQRPAGAGARAPRPRRPDGRTGLAGGRRGARRRRRSAASTRRSRRSSRHVARGQRGSPSTATTTSTASARRRSSCARCAPSAPTSTGTCPAAREDGYGLTRGDGRAPGRARARACCVTADCGITAVEEVAAARALGPRRRRHRPPQPARRRRAARRADRPSRGRRLPVPRPVRGRRRLQARRRAARGRRPRPARRPTPTSTSSRWPPSPTACRCAARTAGSCAQGLLALARTEKPGLRALMRVARVDPGAVDARAIGFRLAPRINAAGRLHRADAALELLLTEDEDRAARGRRGARPRQRRPALHRAADPLRGRGAGRRARASAPAYVLAGDGWHPGVIGIVASRIAERHHRPVRDASRSTATRARARAARSPPSTCSAGLDACAAHLLRHGGHRAAAGLHDRAATRSTPSARRSRRTPRRCSTPEDLVPVERVDAVVAGDELGPRAGRGARARWPRSASATPPCRCSCPPRGCVDPRPMGEGKHLRFTVEAGGVRARAVAFGTTALPERRRDGRARRDVRARAQRVEGRRRAAAGPAACWRPTPSRQSCRRARAGHGRVAGGGAGGRARAGLALAGAPDRRRAGGAAPRAVRGGRRGRRRRGRTARRGARASLRARSVRASATAAAAARGTIAALVAHAASACSSSAPTRALRRRAPRRAPRRLRARLVGARSSAIPALAAGFRARRRARPAAPPRPRGGPARAPIADAQAHLAWGDR